MAWAVGLAPTKVNPRIPTADGADDGSATRRLPGPLGARGTPIESVTPVEVRNTPDPLPCARNRTAGSACPTFGSKASGSDPKTLAATGWLGAACLTACVRDAAPANTATVER